MGKLRRVLRLLALSAKMDLAWLLRDRAFALIAIASDTIASISSVVGVFLLAWRFDGIGGMGKYEVLFMLAYSTVAAGIFTLFSCGGNNGHVSRIVGRGQLEHMWIQPLPLPTQLLTMGFLPASGSSTLLVGAGLMAAAVNGLGIALPWWWWLSLVGNLLVTVAIKVGQSYLASSLTFYAPVQAEEISTTVLDSFGSIADFPLSGMPLGLQIPLLTILPTGLLAWFPTLALLGKAPLDIPTWYPLAFALVLWAVAQYFFRKGLRYYVRKGINRYSAIGHRR